MDPESAAPVPTKVEETAPGARPPPRPADAAEPAPAPASRPAPRPAPRAEFSALPWRRVGLFMVSSYAVVALHALCAVIMVLRGVPGDLSGRAWYEIAQAAHLEAVGSEVGLPVMILSVLVVLALAMAVTTVTTLGEEIGWRGWLWPALKPLGIVPGAVLMAALGLALIPWSRLRRRSPGSAAPGTPPVTAISP